ncbi:iron-containing alcohol dehydrogenase [Solidesulfovibrio alcoholivorans]|uniref:iron-containing alcohol dehydrogenase n=1 Tax=Solidesulfovibrio alcoholivorans TaxID=81406 RepID=UPI00049767AC|nr:iron-containing alcohol dehydrogenase [Solidesulfovibrio alcoholivorans]
MSGWEAKIDIRRVFLLQATRPKTFFGVGALAQLDGILREMAAAGQDRLLVVTDAVGYKASGAWNAILPMLSRHVAFEHYDGVRSNPTFANGEAAAKLGRELGAKAVLGIGGGSAIDTAKTAAALLRHPIRKASDFYEKGVPISGALPIVAVNTTHGSGSECDCFAAAQADGEDKPALRSPHLYPTYAIEDPSLTTSLPPRETLFTTLDALSHALEAATAVTASPYSVVLGKEAVRLIAAYLPTALAQPEHLAARYWLLYASAIAGMSFDRGMLHVCHALEHAMSALNADISHGEGLGILLPAVLREIYPAAPEALAEVLEPIVPGLRGLPGEATAAERGLREWFEAIGQPARMTTYFTGADVPALTRMTLRSPLSRMLLPLAPLRVDAGVVERIFQRAL